GQSAYAIGYSKISDNGKWLIRASVSSNTQRDTAIGGGVGFVWQSSTYKLEFHAQCHCYFNNGIVWHSRQKCWFFCKLCL
ncbi:YadA-like family protein, partial [Glaesserella parasuis]|nr:YadA-like family protein [Glaesserella parasuis]